MIKGNLQKLNSKIAEACARSRRSLCDIKLVCVTKEVGADDVIEAAKLGIFDIGENRIQDAKAKFTYLEKFSEKAKLPKLTWHMIGHLQTNKVKEAVKIFNLIHSVDSLGLAEKINSEAILRKKNVDVLIQINTSEERQKFGIDPKNVFDFLDNVSSMNNLHVLGFMTMAPFVENPEETRDCFRNLRVLRDRAKQGIFGKNIELRHLSMGMSNDFEVAIEEGADIIRIGRAIFKHE